MYMMIGKLKILYKKIEYYALDLIVVMLILIAGTYHWKDMDVLAVFGDEFGYWGNAAILTGFDWKSLMAETSYYSIGYSLLILPILFMKNYVLAYHLAIILNILLTIGCFLCARYISARLFNNESRIKQICSSLVSVLTVNVIVQMRVAWDEVLLCFLMWLSIVFMIKLHESYKAAKLIITSLMLIYMVMVHQRALPVAFLFILIMLVQYYTKADWKKIILFLITCTVLYIIYEFIKTFQIAKIYSNSASSDVNTISGNTVKGYLQSLFDVFSVMASLGAKFIMYNVSTGFTFLAVSIIAIKNFFVKADEEIAKCNVIRYIWLSGVIMLCLTAIQSRGLGRADMIVYTRYFDFTIGPMLLIGINYLDVKKMSCKICLLISWMVSWFSIGSIYDVIYDIGGNFNYICSPIMGGNILWFDEYMKNPIIVKSLTRKVIFGIGLLLFLYIKRKSNKLLAGITMSVLILNFILANKASDGINSWREHFREDSIALAAGMANSDAEIFFIEDPDNLELLNLVRELQYVLHDRTITVIGDEQVFDITADEYYIITIEEYNKKNFDLIVSSDVHQANLYYVRERD